MRVRVKARAKHLRARRWVWRTGGFDRLFMCATVRRLTKEARCAAAGWVRR